MGKRILIVDDERVVLGAIRKILKKTECQIDTATSAQEALKLLVDKSYEVVITDLMMPQMNGLELMRRMGELGCEASSIMLTGYPTIRTALEAKRLGAFEYVTKPFTRQELLSVVVRALRQKTEVHRPVTPSDWMEHSESVYLIPGHSWVRMEPDRTARMGMARAFAASVGEIRHIDLPAPGDRLEQGRACVIVRAKDDVEHYLHAPLSGQVLELNRKLLENVDLAREDPGGEGWLLRFAPEKPDSELDDLMPAASVPHRQRDEEGAQ